MAFDAFVSYSHAADGELAPALQRAIQRFAKPWYRARALRVFRDESALAANPHLWSSIQAALDESEWFVLLASPDAVASAWVTRELEYWLTSRSRDRILVVLTDGTWEWDATAEALIGSAVPPVLRDAFSDEPRHLDLRWAHAATDLDMRNARFRDAVAQLAAPMHGLPKDELESEDIVLHRRARRLARGGVTVLVMLVVVALVASGLALVQRRDALTQRNHANRNANVATAERLGAVAIARRTVDDSQALLLAVEGYRRADTVTTRSALLGTLTATPQLAGYMPGPTDATASAISPDGRLVVAGTNDGAVRFWDTQARSRSTAPVAPPGALRGVPVVNMAFDGSGAKLFVLHRDGRVEQWNPAARRPLGAPMAIGSAGAATIAVRPDGGEVVVDGAVYDVSQRRRLGQISPAAQDGAAGFQGGSAYSVDGNTVFSANVPFDARTLQPLGPALLPGIRASVCTATICAFAAGNSGNVVGSSLEGGSQHTILVADQGRNPASIEGQSTSALLGATVVDATTRRVLEYLAPTVYVTAMAISRDARIVAIGGDDGTVQVWPSRGAAQEGASEAPLRLGGRVVSLSLADDGASLVSTTAGGSTVLWNLTGNGVAARAHALPNDAPILNASGQRSCDTAEAPVNTTEQPPDVGFGSFVNNTCRTALSLSPTGADLVVSGDRSSVWDLTARPARLVRTFGPQLTSIATPLALDPAGRRVLLAEGFSLPTPSDPSQGRIGAYAIAGIEGSDLEKVLSSVSIVSDPNSGPYVLTTTHGRCFSPSTPSQSVPNGAGICGTKPLVALDPWTGRELGSFRPSAIVDQLVRAREAEVFDAPQSVGTESKASAASHIRDLLAGEPLHAIIDAQGRRAATVSAYGDVTLWDLRSGRPIGDPLVATGRATPSATAIAFSPDGEELAVGRLDGKIERYSVPSLRPTGRPIASNSSPIGKISYQPSGTLIAAASADAVDLIDRATGGRIATLPYAGANPIEGAFSTDQMNSGDGTALFGESGRLLVANGYAGAPALVVSLVPADWVSAACEAAGRNLTKTEWTQLVGSNIPYHRTCPEWPAGT